MKINHSFQINSLLRMIPPHTHTLLGELFCEGKKRPQIIFKRELT